MAAGEKEKSKRGVGRKRCSDRTKKTKPWLADWRFNPLEGWFHAGEREEEGEAAVS